MFRFKHKQSGVTLTEMTLVVGIVGLLAGLTLPAAKSYLNSLTSTGGAKSMISGALTSARAMAVQKHRYVGVRFQKRYHPTDPIKADQYMIFIVHDSERTNLQDGFRAIENLDPIKLPQNAGVMDLCFRTQSEMAPGFEPIDTDVELRAQPNRLIDTTTFCIVFDPTGKLVIHDVRVRRRDILNNPAADDIFNGLTSVQTGSALFLEDDDSYPAYGNSFGEEYSRKRFVIYNRDTFKQVYEKGVPFSGYLQSLRWVYINPYTGRMISED